MSEKIAAVDLDKLESQILHVEKQVADFKMKDNFLAAAIKLAEANALKNLQFCLVPPPNP